MTVGGGCEGDGKRGTSQNRALCCIGNGPRVSLPMGVPLRWTARYTLPSNCSYVWLRRALSIGRVRECVITEHYQRSWASQASCVAHHKREHSARSMRRPSSSHPMGRRVTSLGVRWRCPATPLSLGRLGSRGAVAGAARHRPPHIWLKAACRKEHRRPVRTSARTSASPEGVFPFRQCRSLSIRTTG